LFAKNVTRTSVMPVTAALAGGVENENA